MIKILKYKKIYYIISSILIGVSLFSLIFFGMNLGIEFTGGSIMEVEYQDGRPTVQEFEEKLAGLDLGEIFVQPVGEDSFAVRMKDISKETYKELSIRLEGATKNYFESIGPAVGEELKNKVLISAILATLAIIIYIAVIFSGTGGRKIKSWQYGIIAVGIAFFHDVFIVLGLFSILGHLYNIQMTVPIAVALLTVLGYSINDTVVIFDRIRENLSKNPKFSFSEVVGKSLNQTIERSINTSLTTLFVLFTILFLGGETIKWFALSMIVGISLGTYSSLFLAGPLLVSWVNLKEKRAK